MSPRAHGRLNCQLRRQLAATACDCFSLTKCPGSARVSLDYGRTNLRQQQQPPPLSSSREHKTIEQAPLFNSLMRNCRQRILALARFSPIWSAAGISPASQRSQLARSETGTTTKRSACPKVRHERQQVSGKSSPGSSLNLNDSTPATNNFARPSEQATAQEPQSENSRRANDPAAAAAADQVNEHDAPESCQSLFCQ